MVLKTVKTVVNPLSNGFLKNGKYSPKILEDQDFELVVNPPQEVYDQMIDKAAETNGWAHQPYDYKFWKDSYDGYWFFAILDKDKDSNSNLVASGSLARWDDSADSLFSVGLYYTVDEYRGKGYGSQIFKLMMEVIGGSNACLTGALDMSKKYADVFGFKCMPSYWHLKATCVPSKIFSKKSGSKDYCTKPWDTVDPLKIDEYDYTVCPRNRRKIMRNWFKQDEVYTKVVFDKSGEVVGYGSIRTINFNRLLAGPFYAENLEAAGCLLADLAEEVPDFGSYDALIFWYPEINKNMDSLLRQFFPSDAFSTELDSKVQFTKKLISPRDEVVYAVTDSNHQFV